MSNFETIRETMEKAGVREAAIGAFELSYAKLLSEESGMISERDLEAIDELPEVGRGPREGFDPELLGQTVVIKLNGGLGTGMGLQKAKSLLEVREGLTFLDIIARQIVNLRKVTGAQVRFLLMNSFSTTKDTLAHMQQYAAHGLASAAEVELMQNLVPKIDQASMEAVKCPGNPEMEWCPPGHGDLYPALIGSGWLDRLREAGVKYAFASNSDNLGAVLDATLLAYFAESEAPFMMEVTRRTQADKKGGHLARRKSDGRMVLREVAQCADGDLRSFQNITKHCFFNTNNLWVRLDRLKEILDAQGGVLPLPMICNDKTVDPRDKESTAVFQLETAMGAAIECFEGATAVDVPRARFAPVKTTADLLALRSDAYQLLDDGRVMLREERKGIPPIVMLSPDYMMVNSLDEMGVPSLKGARSLTVQGAVRFGPDAVIEGDVELNNDSSDPLVLDRLARDEVICCK
ncbi:MAG: UTP--glucose-1-phosphate uridylyltransferase [Akkermansiaceae bacterium]